MQLITFGLEAYNKDHWQHHEYILHMFMPEVTNPVEVKIC